MKSGCGCGCGCIFGLILALVCLVYLAGMVLSIIGIL